MTRICPKCKTNNPNNAGFCQNCGKNLKQSSIERKGSKGSYSWLFIIAVCFIGFIMILGVVGVFFPGTNSGSLSNKSDVIETTGTGHSVANFTGKGDDETLPFEIKGNLLKIKVEVESSHYGTATLYIYPEGKTVNYIGQKSVSSFSKSSNRDEFNLTVSPGRYYIKIDAEDQSNWDMDWEIEVFDYY